MSISRITEAVVIPRHYIAFPSLSFVAGAISKDETRYVLNHIEVKKRGMISTYAATDGRRLHVAELDPGLFDDDIDVLEPGLYLLISKSTKFLVLQKSEEKLQYPDWQIILGDYEIGDNLAEVCEVADSGKIGEVMIRTERLVDTSFLSAAMGYGTSRKATEHVEINFEARPDGPVIIAHDHGTALVMPLRRVEAEEGLEAATYETTPIAAFANALEPGGSVEISVDGKKVSGLKKGKNGKVTLDNEDEA